MSTSDTDFGNFQVDSAISTSKATSERCEDLSGFQRRRTLRSTLRGFKYAYLWSDGIGDEGGEGEGEGGANLFFFFEYHFPSFFLTIPLHLKKSPSAQAPSKPHHLH